MGASSYPVASGFHMGVQLLAHVIPPLDSVRSVCRRRQPVIKETELLFQALHVGIVPFTDVEYQASGTVQRFQVSLDAYELVGLVATVGRDVDIITFLLSLGEEQRHEHLLVERVLELVVLYIVALLRPFPHVVVLVVVPVYELIVGDVLQIAGINIERTFIQPHEKIRLEGVLLRLPAGGVARCRAP